MALPGHPPSPPHWTPHSPLVVTHQLGTHDERIPTVSHTFHQCCVHDRRILSETAIRGTECGSPHARLFEEGAR